MRDTRHWRRLGDEFWLYRLDATFRLTLEGLGLYLAPVRPDTVLDYRFCPTEEWLELGFEWNLNRGDSQHIHMEVDLLGALAAGDSVFLRLGECEWEVPPFPPELVGTDELPDD